MKVSSVVFSVLIGASLACFAKGNSLIEEVFDGDAEAVELLLKAEAKSYDLNLSDVGGNTALTYAIANNNTAMVRVLLKYGAKVDYIHPESGDSYLHEATKNKNIEMVKMLVNKDTSLITKKNKKGETPLSIAEKNKDKSVLAVFKPKEK